MTTTDDRCAECGRALDPAVFHDSDDTDRQLCDRCCPACVAEPLPGQLTIDDVL